MAGCGECPNATLGFGRISSITNHIHAIPITARAAKMRVLVTRLQIDLGGSVNIQAGIS